MMEIDGSSVTSAINLITFNVVGYSIEQKIIMTLTLRACILIVLSTNKCQDVLLEQTVPCRGTTNDPNVALSGN